MHVVSPHLLEETEGPASLVADKVTRKVGIGVNKVVGVTRDADGSSPRPCWHIRFSGQIDLEGIAFGRRIIEWCCRGIVIDVDGSLAHAEKYPGRYRTASTEVDCRNR